MRTYPMTEQKRQRWIDEGRGTGEGPDYKPWLTYYDVASTGNKHRLLEGRYKRLCHLFSDVERRVFLYFDASKHVEDVLEQYPLELSITRAIAQDLGINHPRDPRSGVDITMTTDIVVKLRSAGDRRRLAISCKRDDDLGDFNSAEHAEIERRYWAQKGVPWHLATDANDVVPDPLAVNLELLYPRRFLDGEPCDGPLSFNDRKQLLLQCVRTCSCATTLQAMAVALASTYGLPTEKWLHLAYYLIYRHVLVTDLRQPSLDQHDVTTIARLTWGAGSASSQEAA